LFDTLSEIEIPLLQKTCSYKSINSITLTAQQQLEFDSAKICYICKKLFSNNRTALKNRDHNHLSGEYRGAACTWCNLLSRSQKRIPIYFHNFCRYDRKLVVQALANDNLKAKCHILPLNSQNFRSITFNTFSLVDSLEHLPASLDKLISELNNPSQNHNFSILSQSQIILNLIANDDPKIIKEKLKLISSGKGTYPYQLCNFPAQMKKKSRVQIFLQQAYW